MQTANASQKLQIDLEPDSLGVGQIFLDGRIRNEILRRYGFNQFCSIPKSWGEKMGFVLKKWWFCALRAVSKSKFKKL